MRYKVGKYLINMNQNWLIFPSMSPGQLTHIYTSLRVFMDDVVMKINMGLCVDVDKVK